MRPHFDMVLPEATRQTKESAKVVGTLMDLAEEVLGALGAANAPTSSATLRGIPLLSWLPNQDLVRMQNYELVAWVLQAIDLNESLGDSERIRKYITDQRAKGEPYIDLVRAEAVSIVERDPIAVSRNGVFIVNKFNDHSQWRRAMKEAISKRKLKSADDVDAVYWEWREVATERTRGKIELRNNRPVFVRDASDESRKLAEFARANPGVQHVIIRGLPHTNLTDLVFQRLFSKLHVWFREVMRAKPIERKWVDEDMLEIFISAFSEGRFYLIEQGSPEFGRGHAKGFAHISDHALRAKDPLVAVWINFRRSFLREAPVFTEAALFGTTMHEIGHIIQDRKNLFSPSPSESLTRKPQESDEEFIRRQASAAHHNFSFYKAFAFNHAMAMKAGLVHPESWTLDDRWSDPTYFGALRKFHADNNPEERTNPIELEAELNKNPTGAKRTLEPNYAPDLASYFSDDEDFGKRAHFDMVLPTGTRKSKESAKVVGTLMDLAIEVLGEEGAQEVNWRTYFQRVPLLSWHFQDDFDRMGDRELADWVLQAGDDPVLEYLLAGEDAGSESYRSIVENSARLCINSDPIAVSRQGVYIANSIGSHSEWRRAMAVAVFRRQLKSAADLEALYKEWKKVATRRTRPKLEKRNGRSIFAISLEEEREALIKFAETNHGVHHMILRGLPHTNLTDLVFQRLYTRLEVWVREVERAQPAELEWVNERALKMFITAFKAGRFYLIEQGPRDFGHTDQAGSTFGYFITPNEQEEPLLAITIRFRMRFTRDGQVYEEEGLFENALHEIAHISQHRNPSHLQREEEEASDSEFSEGNFQDEAHNLSFYQTFIFNHAMAQRAGLIHHSRRLDLWEPFGNLPTPKVLTKEALKEKHDSVNYRSLTSPAKLEAKIKKNPGGAKHTLEPNYAPDQASYFSDDEDFGKRAHFDMVLPTGTRKSTESAKVVGTLMDLAIEVLGEKDAQEYHWRNSFRRVPLLSWLPEDDFGRMGDRELADWVFQVLDDPSTPSYRRDAMKEVLVSTMAEREADGESYRDIVNNAAKKLVLYDSIFVSRQGVYIASGFDSHESWRTDLYLASVTRRLKSAADLDEVYKEWKRTATRRTRPKLETRNDRPIAAADRKDETAALVKFAQANPGVQHMILRGLPHTNLADFVFQRLYFKLQVWVREVERAKPVEREWLNESALDMFLAAFKEGRFYLIEQGPNEFGRADELGATYAYSITPNHKKKRLLAISILFRQKYTRGGQVMTEGTMFLTALHEIAHILQYRNILDLLDLHSDSENDKIDDNQHNLSFYKTFIFNYAMAQRAGLIDGSRWQDLWEPFGDAVAPENFTKDDLIRIHDAVSRVGVVSPAWLEDKINENPGGAKRTLEPNYSPDLASTFSDDEDFASNAHCSRHYY